MTERPSARRWRCTVCDHIYDPAEGDPFSGIPAGTPFEDLPETWTCPDCGAGKQDFEPID
jgi:rubredoxin